MPWKKPLLVVPDTLAPTSRLHGRPVEAPPTSYHLPGHPAMRWTLPEGVPTAYDPYLETGCAVRQPNGWLAHRASRRIGGLNHVEWIGDDGKSVPIFRKHDAGAQDGVSFRLLGTETATGIKRKKNPTGRGTIRIPHDLPLQYLYACPRFESDVFNADLVKSAWVPFDYDSADYERMAGVSLGGSERLIALWADERLVSTNRFFASGWNQHILTYDDSNGIYGSEWNNLRLWFSSTVCLTAAFTRAWFLDPSTGRETVYTQFAEDPNVGINVMPDRVDLLSPLGNLIGYAKRDTERYPTSGDRLAVMLATDEDIAYGCIVRVSPVSDQLTHPVRIQVTQARRDHLAPAGTSKELLPYINAGPRVTVGCFTDRCSTLFSAALRYDWTVGSVADVRRRLLTAS